MPGLFSPITIGALTLKNRVVMSPMCQYQAKNERGVPENWHLVHYASRAIGGTGLILTEMTNVEARGRITEHCLGIYDDAQRDAFRRIVEECHRYDAKIGIQIAHAGRKSTLVGGDVVGPSAIPFSDKHPTPRELSKGEIEDIVTQFAKGTKRAVEAGVDVVELHGAHGYLIHQFMSPASNHRDDEYGDVSKFALDVIRAVRQEMPAGMPLIFRVSAVEYSANGYAFEEMLSMCQRFQQAGVDAFDVSTGGDCPTAPEEYPGYQVKYADVYKQTLQVPILSVGRLENPFVAESVIREGRADLVCIGMGMLRSPYWAKEAAVALSEPLDVPGVYSLAF